MFNLVSLSKIISVHRAVIATSLDNWISHSVDIFKELQFCAEMENCGNLEKYGCMVEGWLSDGTELELTSPR